MANEFDQYREALVVETTTIWPEEYDELDAKTRLAIESQLHAEPEAASELAYVRQHTGFARQITVTEDDLHRIGSLQ